MIESPARPRRLRIVLAAALVAAACGSPPPSPPEPEPEPAAPADFDAERALEHVRALSETGRRAPGGEGAEAARAYIRKTLAVHGIPVLEASEEPAAEGEPAPQAEADAKGEPAPQAEADAVAAPAPRNLIARIPPAEGGSEDLFVLAAPYDARALEAAGEGVSGAALLLELGRVLAERPLPYTVRLAFLQGEAPSASDGAPAFAGSRALADALAEEGALPRVRLLLYVVDVCRPEIRVLRDLLSNRVYRRRFFDAGESLGFEEAFSREQPFQEAAAGHRIFFARGFRRSVALTASGELASEEPEQGSADAAASAGDARAAGGEPDSGGAEAETGGESRPGAEEADAAGATAGSGAAGCEGASLMAVGETAGHGLRDLASLLRKVDRFATRPSAEPEDAEPDEADPDAAAAEEAAGEASAGSAPSPAEEGDGSQG